MAGDADSAVDLRDAAATGIRWSAISRPTIEFVQLASVLVLARLVAPSEFGRFAVASVGAEIALLLVAGGLGAALVQRKVLDRAHTEAGMGLAFLGGLGLSLLMLLSSTVIVAPIFGARTALFVRILSPLCLIEAVATVPVSTLRRQMKFRRLSLIEILGTVVRVGASIALAVAGLEGEALVLGMLAGSIGGAIAAFASVRLILPRLRLQPARELLAIAVPISFATISWVGFYNVDYAVIGARLGALSTGFYYRAYTLAVEYQSKIGLLMNQVGFPVLARSESEEERSRLYSQMISMLTITLFPLLVLLAVTAPVAVPFLFGERWTPAVVPTQILAIGGASMIIFNSVRAVLMARGQVRTLVGFGWTQFLLYGVAVFFAAPFGLVAVAVVAAVVHAAFALIGYSLMIGERGMRPLRLLWHDIAPATLSCLGLVAVAIPLSLGLTALDVPPAPWLALVCIASVPPYVLVLKTGFPSVWRAQCRAVARILPGSYRLNGVRRRLIAAAAQ